MKRRDTQTPELPNLHYFTPTVRIPQGDGSVLLRPGKPELMGDEVTVRQFARTCGLDVSTVLAEIHAGRIREDEVRRKTLRPKSAFLIKVSALERYRAIRLN